MRHPTNLGKALIAFLLAGTVMVGGNTGAIASEVTESAGHEVIAGTPDGVTMWMVDCYVSSSAPEPEVWNGEVVNPGRSYGCDVSIEVTEQYEQEHGKYTVPVRMITETAAFEALGAPYIGAPPDGIPFCAPGADPHYLGIASVSGGGSAGSFGPELGGFHENFYDTACLPNDVTHDVPGTPAPTKPDEETHVSIPAQRFTPAVGSCGYIPLPAGLDATDLAHVMTSATPIPVSSDGIKATAYVTHKTYKTDIGSGIYEQDRIDIYVIPQLPYDGQAIRSKTYWTDGEAPQLEDLFKSRTYVIDLDALLATPEMTRAGANDLTFTDQAFPGFDVSIGADLRITSDLLRSFMVQSGTQDRPLVTALVAVAPLPAECDVPKADPPVSLDQSTSAPVSPQPTDQATPRSVPIAVKTGVGPVSAATPIPPNVASLPGIWNAETSVAPTIRELLAMLRSAKPQPAPLLVLPAPRPMPFAPALEPSTFKDLWVIDDPAKGYPADGTKFFLAHTHTRGGAIGNAVNEAGLTPGTTVEIAGLRYDVTNVSTVLKADIGKSPIWQSSDPDDAFLIVCLWNHGSLATHNLVIEMHRA